MTKEFPRILLLTAALVLVWAGELFSAEIRIGQPLVVLDPGHGRQAPGLDGKSGLQERDVTLALAREVSAILSERCRVRLTRSEESEDSQDKDTGEAASQRAAFANHEKADIYLSLHLHDSQIMQPVIFYFGLPEAGDGSDADTWQTRALKNQAASKQLAGRIAEAFKAGGYAGDDAGGSVGSRPVILSGPVLPLEGLNMPGVLVEPFAIDQAPESQEKMDAFLKARARGIADGVLAFIRDKLPGS